MTWLKRIGIIGLTFVGVWILVNWWWWVGAIIIGVGLSLAEQLGESIVTADVKKGLDRIKVIL